VLTPCIIAVGGNAGSVSSIEGTGFNFMLSHSHDSLLPHYLQPPYIIETHSYSNHFTFDVTPIHVTLNTKAAYSSGTSISTYNTTLCQNAERCFYVQSGTYRPTLLRENIFRMLVWGEYYGCDSNL
jgi:hypothetical protein